MIGEVVGGYQVTSKIGEGGMGVVYLAKHTVIGRRAVVKVLRSQLSSNQEMVQRFFNEARAAAAISHPGIVSVFDMGQRSDRSAYIIMDYLEGESLAARLRRKGRLASGEAIVITRQILSALSAAHGRGIVHRDLKPDNIFIVPDAELPTGERIKLLDFGIAKLQGDSGASVLTTRAGALMGTPAYMSPEQCRGAGECDQRTDLYAVGVMLFELLTGRPPFVGKAAGDLLASHMRDTPPKLGDLVSGVPQELEEIVATLLAKSPEDRYPSGASAIRILDTLQDEVHRSGAYNVGSTSTLSTDPTAPTVVGGALPHENKPTTLRDSVGSIDVSASTIGGGGRRIWLGAAAAVAALAGAATLFAMQGQESQDRVAKVVDIDTVVTKAMDAGSEVATLSVEVPKRATPIADALPELDLDSVDPEDTAAAKRLNRRAARYLREENIHAALADYQSAIEKDPGHITSRYNYASALCAMGQCHEALAILEQLKELGCQHCLGRLIRARSDPDWKDYWDHPSFAALTQRVHLEQPSLNDGATRLAEAVTMGMFEDVQSLFAPRGNVTLHIAAQGCKKRSCREKHKLLGVDRLEEFVDELEDARAADIEVGKMRCQMDCCTFKEGADLPLQLVKICTKIDTGGVRSVASLNLVYSNQSDELE